MQNVVRSKGTFRTISVIAALLVFGLVAGCDEDATAPDEDRPLLDRVASWSWEFDSERSILTITLTCADGRALTRRIPVS